MNEALPYGIWLIHLATTLFLMGLIWMVQVVHYPLFANVGADHFKEYWQRHTRLITWIVAPTMLTETSTAILLFFVRPPALSLPVLQCAFGLIILIWLSTCFVQIPCHERLGRGFESATHSLLVRTNWFRTAAWTIRSILLLLQTFLLVRAAPQVDS